MLRFPSHLSVQGYDSSSPNISWRGFFRWDNKLFFSREFGNWGGDEKKRWSDNRCDELRSHVTAAQFQSINSHLLPYYFFLVEWDICRMRFEKKLPENGNHNCFGLGLSLRNENNLWEFIMPPFSLDRQYNLYWGVSFYWRYYRLELALELLICKSVT